MKIKAQMLWCPSILVGNQRHPAADVTGAFCRLQKVWRDLGGVAVEEVLTTKLTGHIYKIEYNVI